MWSQIIGNSAALPHDYFDDDEAGAGTEVQPVAKIHEFFSVVEVLFREFHTVDVCKARDSVYTKVCGHGAGITCGSLRT